MPGRGTRWRRLHCGKVFLMLFPPSMTFPLRATLMLWRSSCEPQIHVNCNWSRTKWIIYFWRRDHLYCYRLFRKELFPWCYSHPVSAAFTYGKNVALLLSWHIPAELPTFFFVSVLLILKNMNYSLRIPYIFKTFLLNKTACLIPPTLDYPQWGIMIWIVEDDESLAALYIWLHPPSCLCQTCCQFVLLWHKNL